jgi:hypothetical protein
MLSVIRKNYIVIYYLLRLFFVYISVLFILTYVKVTYRFVHGVGLVMSFLCLFA